MVFRDILKFPSELLTQYLSELIIFRKVSRFINLHFSPRKDVLVKVHNHRMYSNSLDRIFALYLWKFSAMESFETKLLRELTKPGMTVFDIGANIGYYTLILAGLVGENGKVYAFEPDPENYRLLIKNIKANNYNNIIPIQRAVSDKTGKIKLFLSEEHKGNHKIYDSGEGRKSIEIESIALDEFTKENKVNPDIMKMDIEGSEPMAFLGMKNLIKDNKDIKIISEFFPYAMRKCRNSNPPEEFISFLEDQGFKVSIINEKENKVDPITSTSQFIINFCKGKKYISLYLEK